MELFGKIKKGPPVQFEYGKERAIWKAGKIYWLEAVKDVHVLDLTWTLPCLRQHYSKKSEDYLAHLLGHGTLFYLYYAILYTLAILVVMFFFSPYCFWLIPIFP